MGRRRAKAFLTASTPSSLRQLAKITRYIKINECDDYDFSALNRIGKIGRKGDSLSDLRAAAKGASKRIWDACNVVLKLTEGPFRKKLTDKHIRTLNEIVRELCLLQDKTNSLWNTSFSPLLDIGFWKNSPAVEKAMRHTPNIRAFRAQAEKILSDATAVMDSIVQGICDDVSVEPTEDIRVDMENNKKTVFSVAAKVHSLRVAARMTTLKPKLDAYLGTADVDTDLSSRINAYYLPALELTLNSLIDAEKKKSKKVPELETLTLRSIDTLEGVLAEHQSAAETAAVQNVAAEVQAMENLAALKGDVPGKCDLGATVQQGEF